MWDFDRHWVSTSSYWTAADTQSRLKEGQNASNRRGTKLATSIISITNQQLMMWTINGVYVSDWKKILMLEGGLRRTRYSLASLLKTASCFHSHNNSTNPFKISNNMCFEKLIWKKLESNIICDSSIVCMRASELSLLRRGKVNELQDEHNGSGKMKMRLKACLRVGWELVTVFNLRKCFLHFSMRPTKLICWSNEMMIFSRSYYFAPRKHDVYIQSLHWFTKEKMNFSPFLFFPPAVLLLTKIICYPPRQHHMMNCIDASDSVIFTAWIIGTATTVWKRNSCSSLENSPESTSSTATFHKHKHHNESNCEIIVKGSRVWKITYFLSRLDGEETHQNFRPSELPDSFVICKHVVFL